MAPTLRHRAQLYHQLHTGFKSGLQLDQILRTTLLPGAYAKLGEQLGRDIRAGRTLSRALLAAKAIARWEGRLLAVGEANGQLEYILAELSVFFDERSRQLGSLKVKLLYPLLFLLVAIVVAPLPQLAAGALSVAAYFTGVAVRLLLVYGVYHIAIVLPFERTSSSAFNPLLLYSLRYVGDKNWLRLQYEIAYLDLLTLCLRSGLDAVASLKLMQESAATREYQMLHDDAIKLVQGTGVSLTLALCTTGLARHPVVRSFLHSNEISGSLHSDLRTFVTRMKEETSRTAIHHVKQVGFALYLFGLWVTLSAYL